MQIISSKDNEIVKYIKKLKEKKYRDLENVFVIEGIKLIKEAIDEHAKIKQIVICDDCEKTEDIPQNLMYEIAKYDCNYVTKNVFKTLTDVKNPQGILAVITKNNKENAIDYTQDIILALDNVQDPGNMGTILRTADSIGLKQILVTKGSVDIYNPKVVRSTMGAIFRINVIETDNFIEELKKAQKNKYELIVSSLQTNNTIYDVDYNKKIIVIGNEANGVEKEIQKMADKKIKIPMPGKTESLNVSVATGIILYEYLRQKKYNLK